MSKYIESETLELKEKYTDKIAKEIVPFLDSGGRTIFIGVKSIKPSIVLEGGFYGNRG